MVVFVHVIVFRGLMSGGGEMIKSSGDDSEQKEERDGEWALLTDEELEEEKRLQAEMETKCQEFEKIIQTHSDWK